MAQPAPTAPAMIYVKNFDFGVAKVTTNPGSLSGRQRLIYLSATDPAEKLPQLPEYRTLNVKVGLVRTCFNDTIQEA